MFALSDDLTAKTAPTLIAADEAHLAAITAGLERSIGSVSERLEAARRARGSSTTEMLERDQEVHRLTARLHALRRFGADACLGRMIESDGRTVHYIGRIGLTDDDGTRLLVDWRSPAAEPFFAATLAQPHGLVSRRRYRWTGRRITDYWDEVFDADPAVAQAAALDADSAFIASLGTDRSPRMRDVLGTIQADQDAIIRAGSRGALVVDGGPGTGKTVVALHRSAYLLYSDARLRGQRGELLVVGPHQPYLTYIADVLPSLGEDGVRTCTLRDLVAEGATAPTEADPRVELLKSRAVLVRTVEPAVRFYEEPPTTSMSVSTQWADVRLTPLDWAEAFATPAPGTAHNDARDEVWEALLTVLLDQHDLEDVPEALVRKDLLHNDELVAAFNRAWPTIDAHDLVADLWSVPAYLRHCAPCLTRDEIHLLQRDEPDAWTLSDLPFLDAARRLLGDPEVARTRRRRDAATESRRQEMSRVIDELIEADGSDLMEMSMLRGEDMRNALVDDAELPAEQRDALAGPFAHIVVDEAQELTDAEWQMLLSRCPSGSFTVVGDRAQARRGFTESWRERLERVGLSEVEQMSLTVNYRTPEEVMVEAAPVIRGVLPDANVPTSIRSNGVPVRHGRRDELDSVVGEWLAGHREGIACVIGDSSFEPTSRVRSLTPETAKGLEFDLVVLVESDTFRTGIAGTGVAGAVDRYVAMTRATQQLVVLTG